MDSFTETNEKNIISVADEFDYSTQDQEYSKEFKAWRKNKNNPYAFNFVMNKKESVFVDGKGFESSSPEEAETESITRIMYLMGTAMLIWIVIENILSKLIIAIAGFIGINVHTAFFSTAIYGGSVEIVTALITVSLIKLTVPALYLHMKLKMPRKVELMNKLDHPADMICSIAMAFVVCAVSGIPSIYSSNTKEIYTYFKNLDADISVWGQKEFVVYTVFNIIIVSVLSEIFFRGAAFGALRQFGDWFAIIITSLMTGLLVQDIREIPAAVLISAVSAIGMLRSGSIITAIFVRVIYEMYQLALVIIQADVSENMYMKLSFFILGTFVFGAAVTILLYIKNYRKTGSRLAKYSSGITQGSRIWNAVKTFPFSAVAVICLLAAIIKLVF